MPAEARRHTGYDVICKTCGTPDEPLKLNTEPLDSVRTVQLRDAHNAAFHPKGE
jgi:hypothetical protein